MNFLNKKTRLIRYIRHATEIVLLKLIAVTSNTSPVSSLALQLP